MGFFRKNNDEIERLRKENKAKDKRIRQLENLCEEKDSYFKEMISDGLRHGSKKAAQHMADRKKYLNNK